MNTSSNQKHILFYGDSLVYGKKPSISDRFDAETRFTGIMQKTLSNNYSVIEEGLRGRTLSGENSFFSERNGLEQFGPILGSHVPLDLIVIMLGTNDCNSTSSKTEKEFHTVLDQYLEKIHTWHTQLFIKNLPKILLVAPPHIHGNELIQDKKMFAIFGEQAEKKIRALASIYKKFAIKTDIYFFDASLVCVPALGEGVHLDEENNYKLGKALALKVQELLG